MEVCPCSCEYIHLMYTIYLCVLCCLQYIYSYIKAPLFVLNSQYDTNQLAHYRLPCVPSASKNCSSEDVKLLQHFNQVFVEKLQPVLASTSNGYFIDSCFAHCQARGSKWSTISAKGHLMRESFADWYYEKPSSEGATRVLDCPYPCNPTCSA